MAADDPYDYSDTDDIGVYGGNGSGEITYGSWSHFVSKDGSVIMLTNTLYGNDDAVYANSTVMKLPLLPAHTLVNGMTVSVNAVSADGSVIIGTTPDVSGVYATVWRRGADGFAVSELPNLNPSWLGARTTAVSGDGSVIVGYAAADEYVSNSPHAVAWRDGVISDLGEGSAWGVSLDGKVIVGTLENNGVSEAAAWYDGGNSPTVLTPAIFTRPGITGIITPDFASDDGSVVVARNQVGLKQAVAWYDKGTTAIVLGSYGSGANSTSSVTALSSDGSVIVGDGSDDNRNVYATAWYGRGGTPTQLGGLGGLGPNSYMPVHSMAYDVSADGSVIVGEAYAADNNYLHAVGWFGGSTIATDLGTMGQETSSARTVTADGKVIIGIAGGHVAMWKLVTPPPPPNPDPDPTPDPDPNNKPDPDPTPTPVVVPIDVNNTEDTVAALANDTFSVMGSQGGVVDRLMGGSGGGQGFNDFSGAGTGMALAGQNWYGISADIGRAGDSKDAIGWMTLAHAFSDNFTAGATIAHTFWQDMPDNYDRTNNNLGGGIYGQWKDRTSTGTWYMRGSVAINRYDVERTRRVLSYTEPGTGDSTINGWGVQLEAGQSFDLANKSTFGYYGGLRYEDLKMDGYTETNAYFPFTYSDVKSQRSTAYLGMNYGMALTDKVKWSVNGEIEQDLSHKDPSVTASADYIGSYKFDSDSAHTRGSLSTTVSYAFSDAVNVGLTPYVNRTVNKDTSYGAIISLSGKF